MGTFSYRSPSFTTTDRDEFDSLFGFKPRRKVARRIAPKRIPQKPFAPKPGDPGTIVTAGGRSFEVWSDAPLKKVWAIPVEPRDGDAVIYLVDGHSAVEYHADGSGCFPHVELKLGQPREEIDWRTGRRYLIPGLDERHEEPCRHRSHKKDEQS